MSVINSAKNQVGISNTATNNFTLDASAQNGTMKLAKGNAGATTADIFTVDTNFNLNTTGVTKNTTTAVSTTSTFSFNPSTHGQIVEVTLTGSITVTLDVSATSLAVGAVYTIIFKAGDTSGRNLAYNSTNVKMPSGVVPVQPSNVNGAYDVYHFRAITTSSMICVGYIGDVR